ncbi:MAG: 3-deoxy-manno-octulosonate cytidylyltransferase [Cyanothece sp. SIO1E1]|nr:3-deoxy-manno-octulosonate cytidylyltransferase [Cyanothece sp. SIO1E1]
MKVLGVIPARYESTRFPGKPLVNIQGKSMIARVYERCRQAKMLDEVIVATDDQRIYDHVKSFGGEVMMTSKSHRSGTDRCAEVAAEHREVEFVVNIQGDEPFIDPNQIDQLVKLFDGSSTVDIATLAKKIDSEEALMDPNIVKVVFNKQAEALYFSRSTIPFVRNLASGQWLRHHDFYKHIGIYAFRNKVLQECAKLPQGKLEIMESLEQLRWLEAGYNISVGLTKLETMGIDTPEDLEKFETKNELL